MSLYVPLSQGTLHTLSYKSCGRSLLAKQIERPKVVLICRWRRVSRNASLEQAPKKLIDFFDKSLLQHFDFERFLIVRTIPFERKPL